MNALHSVSVAKVAELLDLNNLTKEMNLKERAIECSDVNRPALQLSGYFDHFEERRIQIIGNVEYTYIEKMSDSEKKERYSRFMEFDIPCIIFCRDLQPDEIFMEEAREHSIPVLSTGRSNRCCQQVVPHQASWLSSSIVLVSSSRHASQYTACW